MWGMHWDGTDIGWAWMTLGSVMMILFWGGFFWILISLFRRRLATPRRDPAEDGLAEVGRRYAAGEIDEGEYVRVASRIRQWSGGGVIAAPPGERPDGGLADELRWGSG